MKSLHISPTGEFLYHASRGNEVDVWRTHDGAHMATCPGNWIGASKDGRILLTGTPAGPKAWEISSGAELAPLALPEEGFAFSQRTYAVVNRFQLALELRDALGRESPRQLQIEHDPRYMPAMDAWELSPDNTALVVTLSGAVAGQDWALGLCIDLQQSARRFKFKINKFQTDLPINFSREHGYLLVSDEMYHLAVLEMETGKAFREVWINGFANVAAALPTNPWLVAVNVWEIAAGARLSPFTIHVVNLEHLSGERMQRPRVEAVFTEPESVTDLLCAPDGLHIASLLASGTIHWRNLLSGKVEQRLDIEDRRRETRDGAL